MIFVGTPLHYDLPSMLETHIPILNSGTPLLGQAVKLPGVGGDYIVMGLDAKEKTAELMRKHPQVKHEAVEWALIVYLCSGEALDYAL